MKENIRNMIVGLTVLVALAMLCGMVIVFTGLPEVLQAGYTIQVKTPSTYDACEGVFIHVSGRTVGRVTDISFTDPDNPTAGVTIQARIDR